MYNGFLTNDAMGTVIYIFNYLTEIKVMCNVIQNNLLIYICHIHEKRKVALKGVYECVINTWLDF